MSKSRTLVRGKPEREHGEQRVDSIVKKGRFQRGEGGQASRASLGEVEGSFLFPSVACNWKKV